MLSPSQVVTYMKRDVRKTSETARGLPREIRVSTIYYDNGWETMIFAQSRHEKPYNPYFKGETFHPSMARVWRESGRDEQHGFSIFYYICLGYKVTKNDDDWKNWEQKLEGIPMLDIFGSTQEVWNKLEFLRYLRDKGKI